MFSLKNNSSSAGNSKYFALIFFLLRAIRSYGTHRKSRSRRARRRNNRSRRASSKGRKRIQGRVSHKPRININGKEGFLLTSICPQTMCPDETVVTNRYDGADDAFLRLSTKLIILEGIPDNRRDSLRPEFLRHS